VVSYCLNDVFKGSYEFIYINWQAGAHKVIIIHSGLSGFCKDGRG